MVGLLCQCMHTRTEASQKHQALNHAKKWKPQLGSEKKFCKVTQQCMESPHRWQEKLVTSNKSRGCSWTGGRTEGSVLISLPVTCAGWACYSPSRNVIISSETGCSSFATVLHKSELRCGPLATEINKWLNVSGTKQGMERAKCYTLSCWGIELA